MTIIARYVDLGQQLTLGNAVEGLPLIAYGDSWTFGDAENTPGTRAIIRTAARRRMTLTNRAVSGYTIPDAAVRAIGTGAPATPTKGVYFFSLGTNDLLMADNAKTRAGIAHGLRAFCSVASAAERIENTAFTKVSGTWQDLSPLPEASSGTVTKSTVEGSVVSYTITTAGIYDLLSVGLGDGAGGVQGGTFTIAKNGTNIATVDLNDQHANGGIALAATGYGPVFASIGSLIVGDVIRITYSRAGRAGTPEGYLDALVRRSPTPPTILLVKPVANLKPTNINPTLLSYMRDLYSTVAEEFGAHVIVADPAEGWDPATMLGTDLIHPNDRGSAHLANSYDRALLSLDFRNGMNTGG